MLVWKGFREGFLHSEEADRGRDDLFLLKIIWSECEARDCSSHLVVIEELPEGKAKALRKAET